MAPSKRGHKKNKRGGDSRALSVLANKSGKFNISPAPKYSLTARWKWVDVNWYIVSTTAGLNYGNSASISAAGSWYQVGGLVEGLDRINRIGRTIRIHGFEIKAHVEAAQETLLFSGDYNNCVRFVLYRPSSLMLPTSGTTNQIFPVGDPITSLPSLDYIDEVYFDKEVNVQTQLGPNTSGSGGATYTNYAQNLFESIKFTPPLGVTYTGTAATSVESPGLLLGCVADSSSAPNPSASVSFRIFFEDA
jgi:hypothetical protein